MGARRIDVVGFDPVPLTRGLITFDVYFRSEDTVVLFQQEFGRRRVSLKPLLNGEGHT